jgi:hypothetical protein
MQVSGQLQDPAALCPEAHDWATATRGWLGLRDCLEVIVKKKIPAPDVDRTATIQLTSSPFTDWPIQDCIGINKNLSM